MLVFYQKEYKVDKAKKVKSEDLNQDGKSLKTEDIKLDGSQLDEADLDKVTGGGLLSSVVSNVVKTIGEGLSKAARNG